MKQLNREKAQALVSFPSAIQLPTAVSNFCTHKNFVVWKSNLLPFILEEGEHGRMISKVKKCGQKHKSGYMDKAVMGTMGAQGSELPGSQNGFL